MLLMEAFLNFPMYSTVLLLLAGCLVGCAITISARPDARRLLEDLDNLRGQNNSIQESLHAEIGARRKAEQQYANQSTELSRLKMEHAEVIQTWSGLSTERAELANEIATLKRANDVVYELSRRERTKFSTADVKLQDAETVIERLRARLDKAETEIKHQQTKIVELTNKTTNLATLKAGFDRAIQLVDTQRKQMDKLRQQQAVWQSASRDRRATAEPTGSDSQTEGVRRDPKLGLIYAAAPDNPDDLKLIAGIASALEKRLNDFGVYTYGQIMEWNKTAIAEFSKLLICRDHIRREHWVPQARRLHEKKHGQPSEAA